MESYDQDEYQQDQEQEHQQQQQQVHDVQDDEEDRNSQDSDLNESNVRGGGGESAGGGDADGGEEGSRGERNDENDESDPSQQPQVYIQVAENEDEYSIELPCEPDGAMLLSTVTSQFPGASGIKYRNPDTNAMRAVRFIDGKFIAPEKGWAAYPTYYCVFPRGELIIS